MPNPAPMAIDKFVNELWEEDSRRANQIASQKLWAEAKKEYQKGINNGLRKKRNTLKDVVGSRTRTHHTMATSTTLAASSALATSSTSVSSTISTTNTTTLSHISDSLSTNGTNPGQFEDPLYSELFGNDGEDEGDEDDTELLSPPLPLPPLFTPPSLPPPAAGPRGATSNLILQTKSGKSKIPCACGRGFINKACNHGQVCADCCSTFPGRCNAPSHNKNKIDGGVSKKKTYVTAQSAPIIACVSEAINNQQSLFISYDNNNPTVGLNPREIKPLYWEVPNIKFKALAPYDPPSIEKS